MGWIILVGLLGIVGFLLDREVYFYEGAHLGPRVQAWLYNRWSRKYDEGKRASQLRDDEMLAQPLMQRFRDIPEPFILDFATGTGRLSLALVGRPEFKGHIIALDLSRGMLERAAAKLICSDRRPHVELLCHQTLPLPFPDGTFDAVCALEVLELFPSMDEPLRELTRVLRPGGILLTSRGTEQSGRKAKIKSTTEFTSILERNGFEEIQISGWWRLFNRVLARKSGSSSAVGSRSLSHVLLCGVCKQTHWQKQSNTLRCQSCGRELSITEDEIVLH